MLQLQQRNTFTFDAILKATNSEANKQIVKLMRVEPFGPPELYWPARLKTYNVVAGQAPIPLVATGDLLFRLLHPLRRS